MKKSLSLVLALALILTMSACGGGKAPAAALKPGTYTTKVTGHNAPYTLNVTVSDSAITAIDAPDNQETVSVGKVAIAKITDEVLKNQSLNVDAVTGATVTSATFLAGIKTCLAQATSDTSAFTADKKTHETKDETLDCDVLVIGGGGSGMSAAISAAKDGGKVVIIEKQDYLGGSTSVSGGAFNAADAERQGKETMTDGLKKTVEKYIAMETSNATVKAWQQQLKKEYDEYLASGSTTMFDSATFHKVQTYFGGHETGTPAMISVLCDNALDGVKWMQSLGVEMKDTVGTATGALYQRSHYGTTPTGYAYTSVFEKTIKSLKNVDIRLGAKADKLLTDDSGAVVGAECTSGEHKITVNAKNVVLATGGFGGNIEMRQKYNTGVWKEVPLDDSIGCTNIAPCAQGDGIVMATAAGAALTGMSDIQLHPCGNPATGLMDGIRTAGRNRIFVNSTGDRFVNEGAARDTLCKAIFQQKDSTYWIVVNSVRYPARDWVDENGDTIENMEALGLVVEGSTIEELAKKCNMDPKQLQASVDQYNDAISGKKADPFGFTVGSSDVEMTKGPWYACRKVPTVHHTMGGVVIDTDAHVMNESGSIIKGLYACGEVTGGIHGSNRLGGNAIADCIVFGRIAGTNAASGK